MHDQLINLYSRKEKEGHHNALVRYLINNLC